MTKYDNTHTTHTVYIAKPDETCKPATPTKIIFKYI